MDTAANAADNVELHTPAGGSADNVQPVLRKKLTKGNTSDPTTDSSESQDKEDTSSPNDTENGSGPHTSKKIRLETNLNQKTIKEKYEAFMKAQLKPKDGQTRPHSVSSSRTTEKVGGQESDGGSHGDDLDDSQFTDVPDDDQANVDNSEAEALALAAANKKLENELAEARKLRKDEKS